MEDHFRDLTPIPAREDVRKIATARRINALQEVVRGLWDRIQEIGGGANRRPGMNRSNRRPRFQLWFSAEHQRLYLTEGAVGCGYTCPVTQVTRPIIPKLNGVSLLDNPYWEAAEFTAGTTYDIVCIFTNTTAKIVYLENGEQPDFEDCDRAWLIASVSFKSGDAGLQIDEYTSHWSSDIPGFSESDGEAQSTGWCKPCGESGSEESEEEESEDSDDSDSEESDDSSDDDSSDDSSNDSDDSSGGCTNLTTLGGLFVSEALIRNTPFDTDYCFEPDETNTLVPRPAKITLKLSYSPSCQPCTLRSEIVVKLGLYTQRRQYWDTGGVLTIELEYGSLPPCTTLPLEAYVYVRPIMGEVLHKCNVEPGAYNLITGTWRTPGSCTDGGGCSSTG